MFNLPLWQSALLILIGVAVGVAATILISSRGSRARTGVADVVKVKPPTGPAASVETRANRVKLFLKGRIAKKRSLTVDEAARCLDVSPRRVRRLLSDSALVPIPVPGGDRRVSTVSVLDLVIRREQVSQAGRVAESPAGEERSEEAPEKVTETPEPGPNQLYWYFVDGHGEPLHSIREALAVLGLSYAYTGWNDIPRDIRAKMRRERVTKAGKTEKK